MSDKVITLEDLQAHVDKNNLYLLVSGKVYDVTKFVDEHPGGDEVMLAEAGKDATEAFEDVGHSDEARSLMPDMLVGSFEGIELKKIKKASSAAVENAVQQGSNMMYFIPLSLLGAYFAWRFYSTGQ
ncbi:hypothetical protein JAAARDRAFT_116670 [Jaapia argillacea MUCL 33604]|uniref:Cytochrome b5 heme-binding domain-containing protein n=1 Tax=Jaapia argillacea MUCL 33604 TaxID=933084 RepID=A0A067QAU1_9AGAM|nr:hypothetical protein JAAARDRAFT_116670 [Jaapia argillacea MUCL 33604]